MSSDKKLTLEHFDKAVQKLSDILKEPKNEVTRDSAIKRFEFTFELAWKTMQAYLRDKGTEANSPRDCIKGAFQVGLIEDDPKWIDTIRLRNLTSHTYNEDLAEDVYKALPDLLKLYQSLLKSLNASQN